MAVLIANIQTKQMNITGSRLRELLFITILALALVSCSPPEAELSIADDFLASHRLSVSLNDSANGLNVSFNNQSDSGASYHLLRSSNKDCDISNSSVCADVSELTNFEIASSGSFTDGLPSNTYYYQLRITLPGDVTSTLRAQYPDIDPPSNVVASAGDGQVILSWDTVDGAESYNIYVANQDGVSTTSYDSKIADVTSTFFVDDLSNGVTYYLVITAENANNESGISEQVQATPTSYSDGNANPFANAGSDQNVISGATVSLDGSGSSDSDGSIVSYSWEQIAGDITVSLANASSAIASFTAPMVSVSTVLQFQLSVSDNLGATSTDTVAVAISSSTPGIELWSYSTNGAINQSSPAIGADGTIYIGSRDDNLYALNSENGSEKWIYQTSVLAGSSPAIGADGTVYIGGEDLYALNPEDGSLNWGYQTSSTTYSSPAISSDGTVYVASGDSYLYAIAPPTDGSQSGVLLWSYHVGGEIYYSSSAIGADGTIYIGGRNSYLYAIAPPDDDSQSGVLQWRYQTYDDIDSSPAIGSDGTVYVGSNDGYLYAITPPGDDSQSGILRWRYETGDDIDSSPTIGADGTVYIGSHDGYLYALNPSDGSLQWRYQTDGSIADSSPAVGADGAIYVGSTDDYLYAISPPTDGSQSGVLLWRFQTGSSIHSSPAIAANGYVYVSSNDGKVYAIGSSSAGLADSAWPKFGRDNQNTANGNNPPSVSAGASQSSSEGVVVNLVGSATDDSSIASYLWEQVGGTAVVIFAEDNASASFIAPQVDADSDLVFQLTATDNLSASASATTTVTIQNDPNNQPPIAEAGGDQIVNEGTTVELSGLNSSDAEGSIQSYSWQQLSGGEITLTNPNSAQASFIAPETSAESNLTFVFALIVSDAAGAQAADSVSITVENNEAPIVSAGFAQSTVTGVNAILYGSASDSDGSIVSLKWEETSGLGGIELSADDVEMVSFTVPNFAVGTQFTFELSATDDDGASTSATTTVTVVSEKTAQWTYTGSGSADFSSSPALTGDGTIYVGASDGHLYAFNPDGSLNWSYSTSIGSDIRSSPAIASDGSIYFGSSDDSLYALSPEGDLKWSFPTENDVRSSPAIGVDGRIYFGSDDHSIYALEANGSKIWSYSTGADVYSSPLVGTDGVIYIGSTDGYLYALTTAGTLKWLYQTGGDIYSSPVQASDGTIYVGSDDNYLHAVDSADGSRLWRYQTGSYDVHSSPAIGADGTIYVGSENGLLYALTAAGELIWSYDTGDAIYSSPAIDSAGNIYFGSLDHYLYSLSPQGDLNWRYSTGNSIFSSPTIASNGSIYFSSKNYTFYALRSAASGLQAGSPWPKFRYNALNQGSSHNLQPSADAGANDQVLEGNTFTFNGTATDPDGTIATFAWSQVQGISVSIANADSANASFIAPAVDAATELLFQLQVTDSSGGTDNDTVTITVLDNPDNQPPTANAGAEQSQLEGTEVSLSGSASDADGTISAYSWSQLSGSEVIILDSTSAQASFIAPAVDADTILSFQLLVTDNDGASAVDTATITVLDNPNNQLPVVDAGGDQNLSVGVLASLRGSASDSDGSIVSYLWSETSNSIASSGGVSINRADTATANFTVPTDLSAGTTLTFELAATDNLGFSSSASATITIAVEGSLKWRYQAGSGIYSSPAIGADRTMYIGSNDGYLYAIAPPSDNSQYGELLWRYQTGDEISSSPTVGSDDTIYVGSDDNYLYAITPPSDGSQAGELLWRYHTGDSINSSPAIGSDNIIYVGSNDGNLYSIATPDDDSQSGVLIWRYQTSGIINSSTIIKA